MKIYKVDMSWYIGDFYLITMSLKYADLENSLLRNLVAIVPCQG